MENSKQITLSHFLATSLFWPNSLPRFTQLCFFWISHLHLLAILLYIQLQAIPSSNPDILVLYLTKLSKIFAFTDVLDPQGSNLGTTIMFTLSWIYFAVILGIIGVIVIRLATNKRLSGNEKLAIFYISQFHLAIGFWVVCTFLFGSISISRSLSSPSGYKNPQLMGFYIFLVVFYYIVGIVVSFLSYDPFYSSNILATRNSYIQVILFISKATILPPIAVEDTGQSGLLWYLTITSLLMAVWRYIHLFNVFPYFHSQPMKISVTFACLSILISCANIVKFSVQQSSGTTSTVTIVYVQILLGGLLIKLSHSHLNIIIQNAQAKDDVSLKSESEVFQRLFALMHNYQGTPAYIKSQKNNLFELKFIPVSAKYFNKQDFEDINTQYNASPEDNEEVIRKVIFKTLAIAIKRIRHNNNLKIFLAYYALQSKSNLYMAASYLVEASKLRSLNRILATELMYVLESIIQERYVSKENETLSIKTFVDFKARSWRFTQSICSVCKLYLHFWDSYSAPNLELKNLYSLSTKIEKEDETIRNIWTREIEPHLSFASSLVNFYISYLALVRSAPHTSHILNRKYKSFHAYLDEKAREDAPLRDGNLLSPNNITLKVSLNKANFGKILHVSPNIIDYLGWTQAELTDKNASILLLPSLKNKFNEIILKDLETNSTESVWNRNIHLFLKTKEGYAKPAYLYLAIHPYLQEGLSYLAILRVRKPQYEKIVLNREGMIEGITSNLAENLSVRMQNPVLIEELVSKNTEEIGNYETGITTSSNADKVTSVMPSKTADMSREVYQKSGKRWWEENKKDILVEFHKIQTGAQSARASDILKYNVSVSTQILFGTYFNVLVLKNSTFNDSQHADPLPTAKSVQLKTDAKKTTSIPSQIDINKSVESVPNEQDEDVDEGGLAVGTSNRFISIHSNRDLLSPMSSPTSKGALYTGNRKKTDKTIMVLQPSVEVVSEDFSSREKFENINKEAKLDRMKSVKYAAADIDMMSTQSVSNTSYSARIEKIIYDIPEQKGITLFKILSVVCSVICGIILIVFQVSNNNNINNIGETTLIASNWTRQLGSLVSLNQWVIRYSLLDAGVYQLNRYSWIGTANIRNSNTYRFSVYVKQIAPVAYSLRESISNLDEKTRRKFFEKIPVYDRDNEGQVASYRSEDLFRIIDQILADMDRIAVTNPLLLHDYTPFVAFITDNTLNEALTYGESVVDAVLNSIQDKLDFMENLIICFAGLAAFLSILLLFFSSSIIRNFADDRKKLMNILLRLDTKQIKEHLVLVSNLCKLLEKGGTTNKKLKDITLLDTFYSDLSTAKTSQTYRARPASIIGINKTILTIALGALVLTLFLFVGYILAIYRLNQENNVVQDKINLILDCDMTQYHAILLYYQTFAYIGLNASTRVRELPISQSWNISYNIVNERLTTFINLAQVNQQSGGNSKIVDILTGNLCKLLVAQGAPAANYCPKGFQGQTQKGLIPVANHVMLTLKNAKTWFDQSARTKSDITTALGTFDMIESEPMSYNYWFPGYGVISDLVRNEYLVNSFSFGKEKLVILWGTFYIILGSLGWWIVAKKYTEHRDSWKKMVRMVPTSMIGNNKLFKAYLSINNVK